MKKIAKAKDHAFGKDVFLLGRNEYNENLWLEAAKWDCDWYWGFGYVEVYQGNNGRRSPSKANDISSHSHFDGLVGFKNGNGEYIHHLNESPKMKETVLTDNESWELADLMKSFYTLKEAAEVLGRGSSHISSTQADLTDKAISDKINKEILPKVFARVYEILTPAKEETLAV